MRQWAINKLRDWFHSFRVYLVWLRMRWLKHLEYRFNTLMNSLGSLFWVGGTLLTYHLIYQRVNSLAGWSWKEMLVLYGVYNLWWGLMIAFFNGGLNLGWRVRHGTLDKILLWPGKSFFYASMKFEPELLVHFLAGVAIFIISLKGAGVGFLASRFLLFGLLVFNSFLIIFFVSIIFGATSFWFIENSQIVDFFWIWETLAKYPAEFFSGSKFLYWGIYTLIPVAFIAVVPTEVLLGRMRLGTILGAFLVTFAAAFLARKIWRLGLKRYTGVSI